MEPKSPPEVGFGRVLNSIRGLQQRLDDFSIDDVSRAEANAETLVQQLSSIQVKLAALPLIKEGLSDAWRNISALPDENLELAALSSLEKYSSLNALLTTAGRLQRAVHASPDRLPASEPTAKQTVPSQVKAQPITPSVSLDPADWVLGDVDPHGASSTEGKATQEVATSLPAAHTDPGFRFASQQTGAPPAESSHDKSDGAREKQKVDVGGDSKFDQRLLDDLIESYGDFASFSGTTRALAIASKPAPAAAPQAHPVAAPSNSLSAVVATRSLTTPPLPRANTKPALPPPPAPSEITEVESRRSELVPEGAKSLKRHGEIDRQLKSIIKDYGEYDLYSHRSSLNTKIAAIVAFALLGLAILAFYFFRTPGRVSSNPAHSTLQSEIVPAPEAATTVTNRLPD